MRWNGEDNNIFQLSLTLRYLPLPEFNILKAENKWCSSPSKLNNFKKFILLKIKMQNLYGRPCDRATLKCRNAG